MDIIQLAQASGMLVMLDGRIGREEYHSFYGSLLTLQRFADAVRESLGSRPSDDRSYSAASGTTVAG
jgi:hypothetical protein